MNRLLGIISLILLLIPGVKAQDTTYQNSATTIINSDNRLSIRGYAEIIYNQPFSSTTRNNGKLDVRRMVLFTGYKFSSNTSFVAEIEVEHGNEIYLEQAFINHRINRNINFRAGLILIPMGIVNEYHEPTTFNGSERPVIDSKIAPTTWREVGFGFQGILTQANLAYQIYLVNGFNSYNAADEKGLITATGGFRGGRQKGVKSTVSHANLSAKLDYFGFRNLKVGLATYIGKTQSPLYQGVNKNNNAELMRADSSVVGLQMFGIDARYIYKRLEARAEALYAAINNTEAYNAFTGNMLGNSMYGYFVEGALNVLPKKSPYQLLPFLRYSKYDTQREVLELQNSLNTETEVITAGLTFRIHRGVSLKADFQQFNNAGSSTNQFNAAIGIWF